MSEHRRNPVDGLSSLKPSSYPENLIVGDKPCTFLQVRNVLYESASAGQLWVKLIDVARGLQIPNDRLVSIKMRISNETITYSDALYEILESWRGMFSKEAKLHTLINVLETNLLTNCADGLRDHFKTLCDAEMVNELSVEENLKSWLLNKSVQFQGNAVKLEELITDEKLLDVTRIDKKITEELLKGISPCIINEQVPEHLDYYVDRNVKSRNILKTTVLKEDCNDVFVIEGMEKHQLTLLIPGDETTDVSGNQLVNLTVRFILLQHSQDFDKICNLTTTVVHWMKFNNGRLERIKSLGSIKTLQKHVDESQESFNENEIASRPERMVVIADSPGMGKTCLLTNIAHQIMRKQPTILVRFIILKEFVDALAKKKIDVESIVKVIAEGSSEYEFGKALVELALKTQACVILFDGLDEVLLNQMATAKEILKTVATLPTAKVFVATRPHLRDEIENELHELAYTMNPFEESNQINFLTRFWKKKGATSNDSLTQFAQECASQLCSNMADSERNIAGIPLQCRMLAETYEEQAIRCSNMISNVPNGANSIIISSMFEVYEKHMHMRFEKAEQNQDNIRKAHMWLALELLFPEHCSEFKHLKTFAIPLNELYGFGIIEATDSNNIRFVHRTFAEFLVALLAHENIFNKSDTLLPTILKLSSSEVTLTPPFGKTVRLKSFQFNFPVICYFLNGFLKTYNSINNLVFHYHEEALPFYFASAFHNYENIPVIMTRSRWMQFSPMTYSVKIGELNKRDVLYVVARHSGLELMKMFSSKIDIAQAQTELLNMQDRDSSKSNEEELLAPFKMTYLHVAVQRGDYSIVEYLVKKLEGNLTLTQLRYLIHVCVHESEQNSKAIINDKVQIIKLLTKINHDWIDEKLPDGTTPLLQHFVHAQLLECLIQEQADLDACDYDGNTMLHKITGRNKLTSESYQQVLNVLSQHGFQHFNKRNKKKVTPLHYAVENVELLKNTLELFVSKGADLNGVDDKGYSVLFYAIRGKRSSDLLNLLINLGANTNHRDRLGQNVLHICVLKLNLQALDYLVNMNNMNVNDQDGDGNTPLHLASVQWASWKKIDSEAIIMLLIKSGANVNAVNKANRTPFLESYEMGEGLGLNIIKEMEKQGLHITKAVASKALTHAFLYHETRNHRHAPLESLTYLISKGGELKWKRSIFTFQTNFWKSKEVQKHMAHIIEYTQITTHLLAKAKENGLLTQQQVMKLQNVDDLLKSEQFYDVVQDKPASFERSYVILRSQQQSHAVEELRECLRAVNINRF